MKKLVLCFLSSLLVISIFSCKHKDKENSPVVTPNSDISDTPVMSTEDSVQKVEENTTSTNTVEEKGLLDGIVEYGMYNSSRYTCEKGSRYCLLTYTFKKNDSLEIVSITFDYSTNHQTSVTNTYRISEVNKEEDGWVKLTLTRADGSEFYKDIHIIDQNTIKAVVTGDMIKMKRSQ